MCRDETSLVSRLKREGQKEELSRVDYTVPSIMTQLFSGTEFQRCDFYSSVYHMFSMKVREGYEN